MLPSLATKLLVTNQGAQFDRSLGMRFRTSSARLFLSPPPPSSGATGKTGGDDDDDAEAESCMWNLDECAYGFVQHMIVSIDRLDDKQRMYQNSKVLLFVNGAPGVVASKFVAYVHQTRLFFSVYEHETSAEWLVSLPLLTNNNLNSINNKQQSSSMLGKALRLSVAWQRGKQLSLHLDGVLVERQTRAARPPLNQDIFMSAKLNRHAYEYGTKLILSNVNDLNHISLLNTDIKQQQQHQQQLVGHQFSVKYVRRDFYDDLDDEEDAGGFANFDFDSEDDEDDDESEVERRSRAHDSRIIVSSPLPSEIIRIDNTQRVMYKIDSPLTGVTTETIELAFRTTQPDGVIFYIRNQPVITYLELVRGQALVCVDARVKNVYLRPQRRGGAPSPTPPLNDNRWHEVKLHRDARSISVTIDGLYYDVGELPPPAPLVPTKNVASSSSSTSALNILTGGYVYLGLADPNNINLSDKRTFVGEMVRGKVIINNIQQKVVQQPYYWPSGSSSSGYSFSFLQILNSEVP